jgi:hypothetical protein
MRAAIMIRRMSCEPIAVIRSYDELVKVIRARVFALDTTIDAVNELGGLPDRYLSKILGPGRPKHFGPLSLTVTLQALGLVLIVAEDSEQLDRVRSRLTPRCYPVRPEPTQAAVEPQPSP